MGTTQPIREKEELKKFLNYYKAVHPAPHNQALIVFGLNTALRISDILALHWNDVYDYEQERPRSHICVIEKKTGKRNVILLNGYVKEALLSYKATRRTLPEHFLFTKTTDFNRPLCRSQAFRIVKKAAGESLHIPDISCHSLRKTFGYHAWKQGTPPALLMEIYNHSSYRITKKYFGISQDERDSVYMQIEF